MINLAGLSADERRGGLAGPLRIDYLKFDQEQRLHLSDTAR